MVSLGLTFKTKEKATHKNTATYFHSLDHRRITTYYHFIEKFGTAQAHLMGIAAGLEKNDFAEPEQLLVRLRAPGGSREILEEYLEEAKRILEGDGYPARYRTVRNTDGSLDAELRIDTAGDFDGALMTLGETQWPKVI